MEKIPVLYNKIEELSIRLLSCTTYYLIRHERQYRVIVSHLPSGGANLHRNYGTPANSEEGCFSLNYNCQI